MITTLGIPVLNRGDFLLRCVTSVDHPVENLVIINNSGGKNQQVNAACTQIEKRDIPNGTLFDNIKIETKKNLGCGPSWNYIFKNNPGPWLITGSDIMFLPGSLALLDDAYEKNPDAAMVFGDGYNVYLMTQQAVEKIGFMDENFYPAYYEDCDHWRRGVLSGLKLVGVPGFKHVHGEVGDPHGGSSTVRSDADLNRKNGVTSKNNHDYFVRKWGGEPGSKHLHKTPYNKDVPVTFWEIDPVHRQKNDIW
jgi:GT2 family glycosyltransferase